MYGYKESFLPPKRNLYHSLYKGDLHRYGQRQHFIEPSELKSMITVPTEENLQKVSFAELYVQYEFKAVMKIKLEFFKWFEEMIKNILKNNQKYLRTKRSLSTHQPESNKVN